MTHRTIALITPTVRANHNPGDVFIGLGLQWLLEETIGQVAPWYLINKFDPSEIHHCIPKMKRSDLVIFGGTPQYNNYKDWKFWYDDEFWSEVIIPNKIPIAVIAGGSGFPDANMTPEGFAQYCCSDPRTQLIIKQRATQAICFTTRDLHSHFLLNQLDIANKYLPCTATFAMRYLPPASSERPFLALVPPDPATIPDPYQRPGVSRQDLVKTEWLKLFRTLKAQGARPLMVCHWYKEYDLFKDELEQDEIFYTNDYYALLRIYPKCHTVVSARLHGAMPAYGIPGTKVIGITIDTRGHAVNIFPKIKEITYDMFTTDRVLELLPTLSPSSEEDFVGFIEDYKVILRNALSVAMDYRLANPEEPDILEEIKIESKEAKMIDKDKFYATDPILIDAVGNTKTQEELKADKAWTSDTMGGDHLVRRRLAFHHVLPYCKGNGIDIGCMANRLQYRAIGIEKDNCANYNSNPHGPQLIGDGGNLHWFKDEVFDYVFASHSLEDFEDTIGILREWWRVIKPGGHLVLIMPHAKYYPRHGTPGANPDHRHDFFPETLLKQIDTAFSGEYYLMQSESFDNHFEFDMVIQKKRRDDNGLNPTAN